MAYRPRVVKRQRRTNAQLAALEDAIVEAVRQDHLVTLRGVFYRVVSAGGVPKTEAGYNTVKRELLKLRRSHHVSYRHITDGTRWTFTPDTWTGIDTALRHAAASYRRALWHDQSVAVQIYCEKDAITGAVTPVTNEWDVPLGIVRGYSPGTFTWSVADSIRLQLSRRKAVYLYGLGDHDRSGANARETFQRRVLEFVDEWGYAYGLIFERMALTPHQIAQLRLPTRPTKLTDTRTGNFEGEWVETDTIPAPTSRRIVEDHIMMHIDERALRLRQDGRRAGEGAATANCDVEDLQSYLS